jgi:hypothetical protein
MSEIHDPHDENSFWEKWENDLDKMPIPEQVAFMENQVDQAKTAMFIAWAIVKKIVAAANAGVLTREEGESFIKTVTEKIKDLQAMLARQWSGRNSEREILEQLHHIYFPRNLPHGNTLNEHLLRAKRIFLDRLTKGEPDGVQKYWKLLVEYAEKYPEEVRRLIESRFGKPVKKRDGKKRVGKKTVENKRVAKKRRGKKPQG